MIPLKVTFWCISLYKFFCFSVSLTTWAQTLRQHRQQHYTGGLRHGWRPYLQPPLPVWLLSSSGCCTFHNYLSSPQFSTPNMWYLLVFLLSNFIGDLSYFTFSINGEGKYFDRMWGWRVWKKISVKPIEALDILALCFLQKGSLEKAYWELKKIISNVYLRPG